ncbi:ImmA/IrrE family metallo-endopeptidase [Aquihabitans sp. McL0605]|uniref:ImmA/IrrE family metallo-endopeptidase n=1 Tax=Aquihabitans sp. McL0605 TaxID=3415671 RepID=UPI003CEBB840
MSRWNPWASLRTTRVELWFAPLHGERGRWTRRPEGDEILLEETLDRRSRREVLAHELVHVERGVGWPDATASTMELEEERVWRTALRRLAPPGEVERFVRSRSTVGPVTVADLAEEFDLSPRAAARVVHLYQVSGGSLLREHDA